MLVTILALRVVHDCFARLSHIRHHSGYFRSYKAYIAIVKLMLKSVFNYELNASLKTREAPN